MRKIISTLALLATITGAASDGLLDNAIAYEAVAVNSTSYKCCEVLPVGRYAITATDGNETRYLSVAANGAYTYATSPDDATFFTVTDDNPYQQVLIDAAAATVETRDFTPWQQLYVVGSFNSWAFTPMECADLDEQVFTYTGTIATTAGTELKFMGANYYSPGADPNGVHPLTNGETLTSAAHVATGTSTDYKWTVPATDSYSITVNPFKLTASVSTNSSTDIDRTVATVDADQILAVYDLMGRPEPCDLVLLPSGLHIVVTPAGTTKILR
ncbi:MAG: hypothetical protein LIP02_04605 [Bacteroidales bacterium]|nr:hypothetical protein [Bacteroidales bacterium]